MTQTESWFGPGRELAMATTSTSPQSQNRRPAGPPPPAPADRHVAAASPSGLAHDGFVFGWARLTLAA